MILHALQLVWNRKRQNALVLLEIVGSFLVLLAVVVASLAAWNAYRAPLGFAWVDVWAVQVFTGTSTNPPGAAAGGPTPEEFLREAESFDAVESAAFGLFPVFGSSGIRGSWSDDTRTVSAEKFPASPGFVETLGIEMAEGRFWNEDDRHDPLEPIVVNRRFVDQVFGPGPGGEIAGRIWTPPGEDPVSYRVVGVVEHFRKGGDLATESPLLFQPAWPDEPLRYGVMTLYLRTRPGTTAETEQALLERFRALAPTWSFDVDWLEERRRVHLRQSLAPIAIGGLVTVFLLLMVGLGLTGVLWQNVTRRTREIGVRRALGATGATVRRQVLLELQVLAALGIGIGGLLAGQVFLLGLAPIDHLEPALLLRAFLLAAGLAMLLATVCGLYPSWLATRIRPAEALHHE